MNNKEIKEGDYVKIHSGEDFDPVELCIGFSSGSNVIPDGWVLTDFGVYPPNVVSKYNGSTRYIKHN